MAQERLRSGSGVAQKWLRSDQEWRKSVVQERPGSSPRLAQEWLGSDQECHMNLWIWSGQGSAQEILRRLLRNGSGVTRSGTGVWPRSGARSPGVVQERPGGGPGVAQG